MTNVVGLFKNQIGDLYNNLTRVPILLQNWKNSLYSHRIHSILDFCSKY
jgi:hypothetical protein